MKLLLTVFLVATVCSIGTSFDLLCPLKWPNCGLMIKNIVCERGETCPTEPGCEKIEPDEEFLKFILHEHNRLRNEIATGKETRGYTGPAANMMALSYDKGLEFTASCNANRCKFQHDKCRGTKKFPNAGQNLFNTGGNQSELRGAVTAWFEEITLNTPDVIDKFPKGNSKPENLEDTYGSLVDANNDMQNDDVDYGFDGDEIPPHQEDNNPLPPEEPAKFISKPGVYPAIIGDIVNLPCETTNPDTVTIWEKDDAEEKIILFQAGVHMKSLENVVLANGTLKVRVEQPSDYGAYACVLMIDVNNKPALTHHIVAATPPAIRGIWTNKNNETVYKQGETMTLTCDATGYPKPTITWHKEGEALLFTGESLTIPNVSRDSAGIYRCLADLPSSQNSVQHKPGHGFIQIHVEHAPQISVKEYLVTSNKERDAELICMVDAFPQPKIVWKIGDEIISNQGKTKISIERKMKFIESKLLITDLADNDFTTYTCLATNSLGRMEKSISLVKVPVVRNFSKPDKSNKDVLLTWKVESSSPIIAHEIQYRKKGETEWSVAKPEVTTGESNVYTVKYTLKDLDAGSYETRVRSQSEHGWSEYSSIIPFEGEKHNSVQQEATSAPRQQEIIQKEAPVGASKTGSNGSSTVASTLTMSIALIFLYSIRQ